MATPSCDHAQFTKALRVTGSDGRFGVLGEYHVKADLYGGFPRYEKIGVDPKKRRQRRFLTHFNIGSGGHWAFSDWDKFLLVGPVADEVSIPKSPDKCVGTYKVSKNVSSRCKGVVNIKVVPLDNAPNVANSSSTLEKLPKENQTHEDSGEEDSSGDEVYMDPSGGELTCKKHRRELCVECGVNFVEDNKGVRQVLAESRYVDDKGFQYCREHRKEVCDICCESYSYHNELVRAQKPGQQGLDEDARAVREQLFNQMRNYATSEMSDASTMSIIEDDPLSMLMQSGQKKKCEYCGAVGTFKCTRCNFTYYCSQAHQAAHRAKHQRVCDQLEGVKLTRDMKNLLRWVGPPGDSDAESLEDEDVLDVDFLSIMRKISLDTPKKDPDSSSSSGSKACAHCGKSEKLSVCSRCKTTFYCCKEHQVADYPSHKQGCRQQGEAQQLTAPPSSKKGVEKQLTGPPLKKVGVKGVTWNELEAAHPFPAQGRTLEVRIITPPPPIFFRTLCSGRDAQGEVRSLAFYCKQPPKGLRLGCVLRWRNPLFHYFLDGSAGARIEDEHLRFITISDN